MPVNDYILLRKGSSTEWSSANPVLATGEPGYDITNNILKVGDGTKSWNNLEPINTALNNFNIYGTGNIDISGNITANTGNFDVISFNIDNESILTKGQIGWDDTEGTMDIGLTDNTTIHIGEHRYFRIRNETGDVLYKGQAVYATGIHSNGLITPAKYVADGSVREVRFMGLVLENVNNNSNGYIVDFGHLENMDLDGSETNYAVGDETWVAGDILYVHPTVAGKLTKVEPKHSISIAIILDTGNGNGNGRMFVRPTSYGHLDDNHDVAVSGATNGQFLQYNSATDYWVPSSSGNFTTLQVNGTAVPTGVGTTNYLTKWAGTNSIGTGVIYDNGTNVGIGTASPSYKLDVVGTGNFSQNLLVNGTGVSLSGHSHTNSDITNWNEAVDDRVSGLLVAGTGINLSYNDNLNSLTINLASSTVTGYEILSSNKDTFTVSQGYLSNNINVYLNGSKLVLNEDYTANDGSTFVLTQSGVSGDVIEWQGLGGPGVYAAIGHSHSVSDITDFNSGVSGLLPVKNIVGGTGIFLSSSDGVFTINATGTTGGSNLNTEDVMDIIGTGIVGGTGISVSYDDTNGSLSVNLYASAITGYEILSTTKDTFTVTPNYLVGNLSVYYNGFKLLYGEDYTATNGSTFVLSNPGVSGDVVEWAGLGGPAQYASLNHSHGNITNSGSLGSTSGLILVTKSDGAIDVGSGLYYDSNKLGIGTNSLSGVLSLSNGYFNSDGDSKQTLLTLRNSTSNASTTTLYTDGSSSKLVLPVSGVWNFNINLTCLSISNSGAAGWNFRGCIKRNSSTTALVGSIIEENFIDTSLNGVAATVVANTGTSSLDINVNGLVSNNIRWTAATNLVQTYYG
jgi:hypothetical protein